MKAHLSVFALSAILIASIGMAPAFGQIQDAIVIATDKASYSEGETILITGEVKDLYSGTPVSIIVKAPNGNLVTIAQVDIGSDKMFSTEMTAGGSLMKVEGTYTITAQYGTEKRIAEVSFEFGGITETPSDDEEEVKEEEFVSEVTDTTVSVQGSTDLIGYEITGGKIISITLVPGEKTGSVIINIEATDDGSLTLTIPRSVFEAEDGDIFVLIDEEEADFDETISETDRTLTIEFYAGSEQIEIIGSWVVPEFGTIAAMILAVAIISIIAISAKSRLSIIPRY